MIILAIDPGFERIGIAVIQKNKGEKEKLLHSECFKTKKEWDFADRLLAIERRVSEVCVEYKPEILCIESLFMGVNVKTGIQVAHARGVIIATARGNGLEIHEYTPLQVKVAVTGYGKSDKKAILDMVPRIIAYDKKISSDDEIDAIAIGLTGVAHLHL